MAKCIMLKFLLMILTFFSSAFRGFGPKQNFREKEKEILDDILGPGKYDKRIRPSGVNATGNYVPNTPLSLAPSFPPPQNSFPRIEILITYMLNNEENSIICFHF